MSAPTHTKQWLLATKPTDMPSLTGPNPTFQETTTPLPSPLPADSLLLKTIYLSNDPAQRGWISASIAPDRLYVPPVALNAVMRARALCEILASTSANPAFAPGNHVLASPGWSEYSVLAAKECQPAPPLPAGHSLTHYLGALGLTGLTAYYGLVEVAGAKAEDVVLVSGAAGATGSMVVQISKGIVGCKRVVGIAGGAAKCKWVKEVMGADECVDYKAGDLKGQLKKATGGVVDVFFDNVGGEMLDTTLTVMARHGRIAACGAIANYNNESAPAGLKNWFEVISNRIHIHGFIVLDAISRPAWPKETVGKLLAAVAEGKIKLTEDMETVVPAAFSEIPETWMRLFEGRNQGKLVTKVVG